MRETDLFQALRTWLRAATGIEVIEAHPNAPRPGGAYISANLISTATLHPHAVAYVYEEDEAPATDGIKDLHQIPILAKAWTWSIHIYDPDPLDRANRALLWAASPSGVTALYPLAIQPIGPVLRVPTIIDGKWEGRAHFDLEMRGYVKRGVITDGAGTEIEIGRIPVDEVLSGTVTIGPVGQPDLASTDYSKP